MSSADPRAKRLRPPKGRRVLLVCGIVSSLLWLLWLLWLLASEALATVLYKEYNPFSQTISELTS